MLLFSLVSAPALAAPWETRSKQAAAQLDEAAARFKVGDFAAAATGFEAANRISPSNKAVWNAAQSYAAAGAWTRALALYDQLLADPELPKAQLPRITARRKLAAAFVAASRLAADQRFDDARVAYEAIAADATVGPMDRAQASQQLDALENQRQAALAAQAEKPAQVDPPVAATPPAIPATAELPPPPPPQQRGTDWLAWSLIGGGVALGGAGGLTWWSGSSLYDEGRAERDERVAADLFSRGDTRRIAGQVLVGVGAVALGVGVTKLILSSGEQGDGARPAVALTTFPGGGGFVVAGGF
ncbi:MAG: hypothetical protein KBG48_11350 [Kofleriaceae bacterium]|nr:hypothetical protein [Kofleriaceae bacterium]MBP9167980.1 hypothetical protein [Kofleriaceae bacterium]MBP9856814.1 hypothetical protein [Kofleriaceae bacterium]